VVIWGLDPSLGNDGGFEPNVQVVGSYIPFFGNAERTIFNGKGGLIRYFETNKLNHPELGSHDTNFDAGRKIDPNQTCFIHPSVLIHDQLSASGYKAISTLSCAEDIRSAARDMDWLPWNSLYSTRNESMRLYQDLHVRYARTLVCGSTGVGKSSLINAVAGEELVSIRAYESKYD
jgi:hypothetical protein